MKKGIYMVLLKNSSSLQYTKRLIKDKDFELWNRIDQSFKPTLARIFIHNDDL